MTFLQIGMLLALPLAALPVLIHLIHQQRHRTVKWAAMMFLRTARRMNHGMARLRQILILAMRVLAVLCLIFAASRPLAGGFFGGVLGGGADTVIVLLDRSASMETRDPRTGESKRETAIRKLVDLVEKSGGVSRVVLVDSASMRPLEVGAAQNLFSLAATGPTVAGADIPGMLQVAMDYMVENETGRTDLWICSDMQATGWQPESRRWESLQTTAEDLPGLRVFLLSYPDPSEANLSISIEQALHRGDRVLLDLRLRASEPAPAGTRVALALVQNGVRTLREVAFEGTEMFFQGVEVATSGEESSGWGYVELPADANPMDNQAYYAFSDPPVHLTVIVSDDEAVRYPLRVAAASGPDRDRIYEIREVIPPEETATIPWGEAALVIWQAPLPAEDSLEGRQMLQALREGRRVLFFPPGQNGEESFLGTRWTSWRSGEAEAEESRIGWWRTDSDLLAHTRSGKALPVGEIGYERVLPVESESGVALARGIDDTPVLTRVSVGSGAAYFCGLLPQDGQSTLARDGIALYVMLHRALASGAESRAAARMLAAGAEALPGTGWRVLTAVVEPAPGEEAFLAGAFERDGQLRALFRPGDEDGIGVVSRDQLREVLGGMNYEVVEDEAGRRSALASEIWRMFLILMAAALLGEAILSLPAAGSGRRSATEVL